MVSEQFHPRQEVVASDWVGISDPRKIPSRWRSVTADRPSSVSGYGGAPAYRPSSLSGYGGAPVVRPSSLSEQGYPRQQMVWSDWCGWYVPRKPPKFLPALAADRPYTLPGYGGGPDRSVGNECLGAIGLGSSACKIPSRFQSRSVELAPAREPHLLRQVRDPSDLRRRLGSAELSGGLERRLVKVPGSTPGKIPKPCSDLEKMTKWVVRYEVDAYDPTAVWRIVHLRPSEQPRERENPDEVCVKNDARLEDGMVVSKSEGVEFTIKEDLDCAVLEDFEIPSWLFSPKDTDEGNFGIPSWLFSPKDIDEGDFGIPSWLFGLSLSDAVDRAKDLAVLEMDAPTDLLKPINVGLSSALRVGQQCLASGNPFGFDHILTTGVIRGLNRDIFSNAGVTIEDGAHFHVKQGAFLHNLEAQTLPKSFYCNFIRLTLEYFKYSSLDSYEFSACKIKNPKHWHYVILPKNIISAFVVMNSTVSSSKKPGNTVSHILTDAQNFHAMKLWIVKNAHKKAYVHVINHEAILLEKLPKFSNQKLYWPEEFRVLIYNISYIRGLFPKKNFTDKSVLALEMKIKKLKPMDDESKRLIDWMEKGAYDAVQKKYLKTLLCCICEKEEDPLILIHDKKVSNLCAVVKVLELALKNHKPLLLVTVDIESEALDTLIIQMLGSCRKVTVSKDDTVILARAGDKKFIEERAEQIRSAIEQSISDYDKEKLQEGLAKLSGGVAVLKIGGASGAEMISGVGSKHMAYLPDMIPCLLDLLNDETPAVARQVVKAGTSLFATVLEQLVIQGLFSSGGIEDSLNISWVITACLGLIKSATSHYDGGTVAIDSKKEFYGLQDLGEDEPIGLTDVVEKSFDRQDRGLRGTRLLWNLPPWPGLCAMICDHFTQHSDYEVLENFYSVKRYNQRVLDYTDKFKELIAVYKSESMKLRHEVGEERKMLQMVEAMAEVLPNARHRFCFWYILKKLQENVGRMSEKEAIPLRFKEAIYDTITLTDFKKKWVAMVEQYKLEDKEWFSALYSCRKQWAPGYVNHSFWAGTSAIRKVEKPDPYLDGAAMFGGIVGQEVMKACSGKFHPHYQFFLFDSVESLPTYPWDLKDLKPWNSHYYAQISVFGSKLQKKMRDANVFVVGSGALGYELLKNLALMGVSCIHNGTLTITDDEVIEESNLGQQFLFRDWNIGQAKSTGAATAVSAINSSLPLDALLNRACPETEHLFPDAFWEALDVVINALNNVNARMYMDMRCLYFQKPLVEPGALGAKCNTQMVIPHLTENYGASQDPPEKQAPKCTVYSFPHNINHCLTWTHSELEGFLEKATNEVNSFMSNPAQYAAAMIKAGDAQSRELLQRVCEFLDKERCERFEDCTTWAILKFEDYFVDRGKQLTFTFPEDVDFFKALEDKFAAEERAMSEPARILKKRETKSEEKLSVQTLVRVIGNGWDVF